MRRISGVCFYDKSEVEEVEAFCPVKTAFSFRLLFVSPSCSPEIAAIDSYIAMGMAAVLRLESDPFWPLQTTLWQFISIPWLRFA